MADLQDDPDTALIAVGGLDDPGPSPDKAPKTRPESGAQTLEQARELLAAHPIADGYSGVAQALRESVLYDLEAGEGLLETDIPRLRDGGVGAQFWSLHVPLELTGDRAVAASLEQLDLVRSLVESWPEGLRLALGADDLADARNCGRIACVLGPVAGPALGDSLGTLRAYYALGVRSVTIAGTRWTQRTGLTPFGHQVVREMNRLGMLVDLSGCTPETMRRTLVVTNAPAVISHHPTPVPDDVLRQLRANGGVCMVACTESSIREAADRLDHVRTTAGPQSTALTGAYDTGTPHAPGLGDVSCFPRLISELLTRGWSEPDIAALTWSNVARVLRDADFVARATKSRRPPSVARLLPPLDA
ncbi:dipeptidase [Streptomyces sp. NPDC020681]|uniref:dipeptidase n=1 Tax=Streptomyces sp. NPDC020681 TaxID=3365083 RepID=UPI0037B1663C